MPTETPTAEQTSTELTKRGSTEVEKPADSVEGQFVTADEMLMMTLQRPDNRNINVRLDGELADWFEDAVDDLAYETRLTKAAITTIAFKALRANWETAVANKLSGATRRRRRR